ncbi:hypothetical protein [Candidatus Chloroploca asiatica]|uniref:Uncharacterized protein n=1 Tax=Candidatus Chloroploca asiatica TaxID=1506545 RepID=A0A2H3KQ16_9CHLR|nr:hypothetical protein [Candidatus Chloroploca asiatica]PDW00413.1 hypothetical protein A9Q02_22920 [Candidatus Chloroploca asiatica]
MISALFPSTQGRASSRGSADDDLQEVAHLMPPFVPTQHRAAAPSRISPPNDPAEATTIIIMARCPNTQGGASVCIPPRREEAEANAMRRRCPHAHPSASAYQPSPDDQQEAEAIMARSPRPQRCASTHGPRGDDHKETTV